MAMTFTRKTAEFVKDAAPGTYQLEDDFRLIIHECGAIEVQNMCFNDYGMYFATTECFPDYKTFVEKNINMKEYWKSDNWDRVGDVGPSPLIYKKRTPESV